MNESLRLEGVRARYSLNLHAQTERTTRLKGCSREFIPRTIRNIMSRAGPPTIARWSDEATSPSGSPRRRSPPGRPRSSARERSITRVQEIGRWRWKKESGYHRQARVENPFFRYKSIIGDRLRARHSDAQDAEAMIACNILNRPTKLGRPASFAIGSCNRRVGLDAATRGFMHQRRFGYRGGSVQPSARIFMFSSALVNAPSLRAPSASRAASSASIELSNIKV